MSRNPAPAAHSIDPVIARRWSPRGIDPDRPVERSLLLRMLEAARWAPSCFGEEPWRYLLWDRFADPEQWELAAAVMVEGNQRWARNAPVLLMAIADGDYSRNGKPNRWAQYDTGAASENLHLQGLELGLVVHQMGGFDPIAASRRFDIPERCTPMAMIAVGYPGALEQLHPDYRERESAPRLRRAMDQWAFEGTWGSAIRT